MPLTEQINYPEWFTAEMIEACNGLTQEQVDDQAIILKQPACVPPFNCANCTNTGCFTIFRDTMLANNEQEIG